jgi:diaminopimelate epimerase
MGRALVQGEYAASYSGIERRFLRVSTGNPHAVLFDATYSVEQIDEFAPKVCAQIVGGANIGFATLRSARSIDLIVWERGVGRTLACGTGAVACVAAACQLGKAQFGESIEVRLPGGPLEVSVDKDGEARLRGPAHAVFIGEIPGE